MEKQYKNKLTCEVKTETELHTIVDTQWREFIKDHSAEEEWVDKNISPYQVLDWLTDVVTLEEGIDHIERKLHARYLDAMWPKAYREIMKDWQEYKPRKK